MMPSMRAQISYDLVMEDNMAFVEGTYRLGAGGWQVFIFSKRAVEGPVWTACTWDSGVAGVVFRVPRSMTPNMASVEALMSEALGVAEWERVRGPDSMNLR
jgi:hypothetical protein